MRLILRPVAWWATRRTRRATCDLRRANFYATCALRVLAPLVTRSGVPAVPRRQPCAR